MDTPVNEHGDRIKAVWFGDSPSNGVVFNFQSCVPDAEDWLHSGVEVTVGSFTGSVMVCFMSKDLRRLLPALESLYQTLRGTVAFETLEEQVGLTFKGDGLGHIRISGFLLAEAGGENRISFSIESDQTALGESIRQLRLLIAKGVR